MNPFGVYRLTSSVYACAACFLPFFFDRSASIVRAGMPVPHTITNDDVNAHPTASSQGSSSAPNSELSASRNPIVVDSDSEDDGEQEDGTDMEIEDGFGGASSRIGTAMRGSGPALSGKRKRRSHA